MKAVIRSVPLLLALAITLAGCGVGPGPDLASPSGASYLSAYSGDWVLLRLDSDDLDAKYREAMAGRPGASAGGMPGAGLPGSRGGGMTGGRSGGRSGGMTGGRTPGGMPGAAGNLDPEEMRRIMMATMAIARTQGEFTLTLRPESVTLLQGEAEAVILTLGGEENAIYQGGVEEFAAAEWTDEGLIIKRKVDGGGKVKDKIRVDEEGRLVVERSIDALRGGKVKGTLRYRKAEK